MKRVQAHYLIMNIAVADFFVGLVSNTVLIAGISTSLQDSNYTRLALRWELPCHFVGPLSALFVYASYLTLSCIALDRCLVVMYGVRYKQLVTKTVIKTAVTLSWALSALLSFLGPQFFGLAKVIYSFHPPESMCVVVTKQTVEDHSRSTGHTTIRDARFSLMESILSMYLPTCILVSSSLGLVVLLQWRKTGLKSEVVRRSCRTVLLMIAGYLVFSIPYATTPLYVHYSPEMYLVFRFLLQTHCLITPLIYIRRDTNFRRAMTVRNCNSEHQSNNYSNFYVSYIIVLLKDRTINKRVSRVASQ